MTVSAQRLAVDPGIGHGVDDFIAGQAHQARYHRGGSHLDQQHVIEADAIEAVLQRDHALNFMRFDHAGEDIAHGQRFFAGSNGLARQVVGHGQDAAEVVGGVTPFRGQPGVIEVEPANHAADVECGHHRVKLEGGAGHLGAVGHRRAGHYRSHQLGAGGVGQGLETAAQRVHQAQPGGVVSRGAGDFGFGGVIGDVGDHGIGFGADVGNVCGHVEP